MNKKRKHYLIYQITNLVNGKIYIGKHITTNIEDDYFGSGKLIRAAIDKYGFENFVKTILFELQTEEEMNLLEKCVVTQEFCDREDTYNINVGGDGGWSYNNLPENHNNLHNHRYTGFVMRDENGYNAGTRKILSFSKEEFDAFCKKISQSLKTNISQNGHWWSGRHHSEETKAKMRASRYDGHGKNNSMYGRMWICNDETHESKSISKVDPIPNGWRKGRFCKKRF